MSAKAAWKQAMRESNALAWIAVLILILAIGAGVAIFGGGPAHKRPPAASQAAPAK